jgi:hypothetical protein
MFLISTSSLQGYGIHKIFTLVAQSRFDGVNLDLDQSDFDTRNAEYLATVSHQTGTPIGAITAYSKGMNTKELNKILGLAHTLGVNTIQFYPPHRNDKQPEWFSVELPKLQKEHPDYTFTVINVEARTFLFFFSEYRDATLNSIKNITGRTTLAINHIDPTT